MVQKDIGSCCICVPLSVGVVLICTYHFFFGIISIIGLFIDDVRLQSGGYNVHTHALQVMVCAAGVIFGSIGFRGVTDNDSTAVRKFLHFQYTKLLSMWIIFVADMIALTQCDTWATTLNSQRRFNPPMDSIAKKGLCDMARLCYCVGFVADFSMNCYFAWITRDYQWKLESCPSHLIRFMDNHTDDHATMTFYNPSVGEPIQYLDPPARRPQDVYGANYGAAEAF